MKRASQPDSHCIEVTGQGRHNEKILVFLADVTATVASTKKGGAAERGEAFIRRCLDALLSAGLRRDEIEDAGFDLGPDWWRKRNTSVRRFIVRTADLSRLSEAMEAVERVGGQRKSVSVHMRQPVFGTDPEQLAKALRDAVAEARSKAQVLAMGCGLTLGPVLNVEEEDPSKRASGFLGDEDWSGWGVAVRRRARGRGGAEPEPLGTPRRTVTVNVRVRFGIASSPPRTASRNAN